MMKVRIFMACLFLLGLAAFNVASAKNDQRNVPSFSEVSLRVPGTLYISQGNTQNVEITANENVLDKILTEVKDRKLIIQFPKKTFFHRSFDKGNIIIKITVPEIDGLFISGSGDIVAKKAIETRILDLAISGSGDINLANLEAERVKSSISGSGDIIIQDGGIAEELSVSISGSGDFKALGFKAHDVSIKTAGSGNSSVHAIDNLKVSIAGSGNVDYTGTAAVDAKVAGSGNVRKK